MNNSFFKWLKSKLGWGSEDKVYYKVREFDLRRAELFLNTFKTTLENLSFVMLYDNSIWEPLLMNGNLIKNPTNCKAVDGVLVTLVDYPCLYYKFESGEEGKVYCYREWETTESGKIKNFGYKKEVFGIVSNVPFC